MSIYTYEVGYTIQKIDSDYRQDMYIKQTYEDIKGTNKIEVLQKLIRKYPAQITEIVYVSRKC